MIGKIYIALVFSIIFVEYSSAQVSYTPMAPTPQTKETHSKYKKQFAMLGANTKFSNTSARTEFNKLMNEHWHFLYRKDTTGLFIIPDSVSVSIQNVFDKLISNNPELSGKKYLFFLYKDATLNAFSSGEGIIGLNLGFLPYLTSLDQLAFILAHELAHDYSKHVIDGIKKYCEMITSKELKAQMKAIKKMKYNRRSAYSSLELQLSYEYLEHSRGNELIADSIAIIFMQNAGFNTKGSIEALELLDSSDLLFYSDTLDLKRHFHFANYPFKDSWLKSESKSNFWKYEEKKELPDSLKTHPDCKVRIEEIKKEHLISESDSLKSLQYPLLEIEMELLNSILEDGDYVGAFYESIKLSEKYPDCTFPKLVTAECLFHFSWAIKNRTFTDYVGFPNEEYPAGINQMYTFLNNCNSTTLLSILSNYFKENLNDSTGDYSDYVRILNNFYSESDDINSIRIKEFNDKITNKELKKRINLYKPKNTMKK